MAPRPPSCSKRCNELRTLELLAPARNLEIGIAAIDCGADAVYIAGPAFGARKAAGNPVKDIAALCAYAHRFGVRIFVTVNTLVYEEELPRVRELVRELEEAGADALIVQDPAVVQLAEGTSLALHASTQCAIRNPETARFQESLGYGRLVLERQLSLSDIRAVRSAVEAELEFFVHGALCVCYSGQCYLSEKLAGRSANRGDCIQACRSLYDLEDADGKVLSRNKAFLSLKDYNLLERLEDLAGAGVDSFKIEGRLKGISYVRNTVRAYSLALDRLVSRHPDRYRRASFGTVRGGFSPDLDKTFNRGYTELFLDGQRGSWASPDAPKSMGEYVGTVRRLRRGAVTLAPARGDLVLANGDGFAFVARNGQVVGFRGDVCEGVTIRCKDVEGLEEGMKLFRNISAAFERTLEAEKPEREMAAEITLSFPETGKIRAAAVSEDGREAVLTADCPREKARRVERMRSVAKSQLEKKAGVYRFSLAPLPEEDLPLMGAAFLNGIRRALAEALDQEPCRGLPLRQGSRSDVPCSTEPSYKANIANSLTEKLFRERGAVCTEPAYELSHRDGIEYMRTKYCLRHELGLCPKLRPGTIPAPLTLVNNGRRLTLTFDCAVCEMTVS